MFKTFLPNSIVPLNDELEIIFYRVKVVSKNYGIFPKDKPAHVPSLVLTSGLWRYSSTYILSSKT
jgi:hypothetical protein